MWVEISCLFSSQRSHWVILLARMWVEMLYAFSSSIFDWSSSLRGCELKFFSFSNTFRLFRHPPCEDVSWNNPSHIIWQALAGHPPCEDVSWNIGFRFDVVILFGHPPCEDVSWNGFLDALDTVAVCHPPCEDVSWNIKGGFCDVLVV